MEIHCEVKAQVCQHGAFPLVYLGNILDGDHVREKDSKIGAAGQDGLDHVSLYVGAHVEDQRLYGITESLCRLSGAIPSTRQ